MMRIESVFDAMEKVRLIRERLKAAQSHQTSYLDMRKRELEFDFDDWVYLKISPMKGVCILARKRNIVPST